MRTAVKAGLSFNPKSAGTRGLGHASGLVMGGPRVAKEKGNQMEEEPLLVNPPTHDVAIHVRDYERFIRLFKISAFACLIIGLIVLMIL
jgi:hypothetical protein